MLKKCIILILLLQISLCFSQNSKKIDSLINIVKTTKTDTTKAKSALELARHFMYKDPKKAKSYINTAYSIYNNSNNLDGISKVYLQQASYFNVLGKMDSSSIYLDKSYKTFLNLGDTLKAATIRHNIGIVNMSLGNPEKSLEIMNENIIIFSKYQDSIRLANAYSMRGSISILNGNLNLALKDINYALSIYQSKKDQKKIAEIFLKVGDIYQTQGQLKKSVESFKEVLSIYREIEHDYYTAQALSYLGDFN